MSASRVQYTKTLSGFRVLGLGLRVPNPAQEAQTCADVQRMFRNFTLCRLESERWGYTRGVLEILALGLRVSGLRASRLSVAHTPIEPENPV